MRRFIPARLFLSAGIAAAIIAPAPAEASFNPLSQAYQEFAEPSQACTFAGDCSILFPAVPSKTIVTHVSCELFLASGGTLVDALLKEQSSSPRFFLQPFTFPASGGTSYAINAEVYQVYTKGQIPRIDAFSDSQPVQDFSCTISGFHS